MTPNAPSRPPAVRHRLGWAHHLLVGPAALVVSSLIDLYLVTQVFVVAADPLVGVLSFFIFGAAIGVPLQILFARSALGRAMDGRGRNIEAGSFSSVAAAMAGLLAAIATITWLYCLRVADAAVVLPLASLTPLIFALIEGAQGRIRFRHAVVPLLILLGGLYVIGTPETTDLGGLTSIVIVLLLVKNLAAAGSEAAERNGSRGSASRFAAARFAWLAGAGVPVALTVAATTERLMECLALMADALPLALPLHAGTMLLTFVGSVRRTQAKANRPLTVCAAVYSTPLVIAPLVAAAVNKLAFNFFPTITGSLRLTAAAALVVTAAIWLSALSLPARHRTSTQIHAQGAPP